MQITDHANGSQLDNDDPTKMPWAINARLGQIGTVCIR